MNNLEDILTELNTAVDNYHNQKLSLPSDQAEILRTISCNLYYLEAHRIDAHENWQREYFKATGSNAAKERWADNQVQELYKIRRIMTGAKIVADAVRSTLSQAKRD